MVQAQLADDEGVVTSEPVPLSQPFPLPRLVTEVPGPRARAHIAYDEAWTSPSLPRAYPLVPVRGRGATIEDVDGNLFIDFAAGIAVNSASTLMAVADTGNNVVRLISLERADGRIIGNVTTLGLVASARRAPEGLPGTEIEFQAPTAVAFDASDNVYVVDEGGASVVVRPAGRLPERVGLAQTGTLGDPVSVAIRGFEALTLDASKALEELLEEAQTALASEHFA